MLKANASANQDRILENVELMKFKDEDSRYSPSNRKESPDGFIFDNELKLGFSHLNIEDQSSVLFELGDIV